MAKSKYLYARATPAVLDKLEQIRQLLSLGSAAKSMQWMIETYLDDGLLYALELAKERHTKDMQIKQAELEALEEWTSKVDAGEIVPGVLGQKPKKKPPQKREPRRPPSGGIQRRTRKKAAKKKI